MTLEYLVGLSHSASLVVGTVNNNTFRRQTAYNIVVKLSQLSQLSCDIAQLESGFIEKLRLWDGFADISTHLIETFGDFSASVPEERWCGWKLKRKFLLVVPIYKFCEYELVEIAFCVFGSAMKTFHLSCNSLRE